MSTPEGADAELPRRPDSGQILINGIDVWKDPPAAKAAIGVVPADARLFDRLSGEELLEYAWLRGMSADQARSRAAQLLDVLDLAGDAERLVADYSTGMRKKAALGCALIHNPPVLFLDEPLEGVDPVSGDVIRLLLTRFVGSGSTVLFSSHVMELESRHGTGRAGLRPRIDHRQGQDRCDRHHRRGSRWQDTAAGVHRSGGTACGRPTRRCCRGSAPRPAEAAPAGQRAALVRLREDLFHHQLGVRRAARDLRLPRPGRFRPTAAPA